MVRRLAGSLVCISWALWFGGLGALFLFVTRLFTQDRPTALKAAPMMFLVFERYQLLLAAAALLGTVCLRILGGSTRVTFLFALLAVATLPAAISPIFVTSKMETLRLQGQSSSEQFKKLHGISMMIYSGETLVLLVAGAALPWVFADEIKRHGTTNP
jgi:hypothetical protein